LAEFLVFQGMARLSVLPILASLVVSGAFAGGKPLNQIEVHYKYSDGDFPAVITSIEAFTHANKTYPRADSIFIAKHLAVVYTANPDTRERGKYYMYQLLELVPSAELVDMYVSDEIEKIFGRVKQEYEAKRKDKAEFATYQAEKSKPPLWKNPWVWGGAAAVAVGGITAAILLHEDDKPRPEYVVP
jgi:hypothetical protein